MKLNAKNSDYKAILYQNARETISRSKSNKWRRKLEKILNDNKYIKDSASVGMVNLRISDGMKVLFEKDPDKLEVICNGFILVNCGRMYVRLADKEYKRLKKIKRFALHNAGDKHNDKVQESYRSLGFFIRRIYNLGLTEELQKKYYAAFSIAIVTKDDNIQYFQSIKEFLNEFNLDF